MTRIKLATFTVSFLLIFSILATVFSRGGLVVNAVLRREVAEMTREREKKEAEVALLREDLEAFERNGEESESVFIASLPSSSRNLPEAGSDMEAPLPKNSFEGLSNAMILLISVSGAIIITCIVSILPFSRRLRKAEDDRKKIQNDERRGGPSSYDDIDFV